MLKRVGISHRIMSQGPIHVSWWSQHFQILANMLGKPEMVDCSCPDLSCTANVLCTEQALCMIQEHAIWLEIGPINTSNAEARSQQQQQQGEFLLQRVWRKKGKLSEVPSSAGLVSSSSKQTVSSFSSWEVLPPYPTAPSSFLTKKNPWITATWLASCC